MTNINSDTSSCPYMPIVSMAMQKMFNRSPRLYQGQIISHILKMMTNELPPEPVLMIQPTGSGKSSVPLTCAVIPGGVTIILENTLALASDQTSKIKSIVVSNTKPVKSFQLDTFKTDEDLQRLYDAILKHIEKNKNTSIICFSSPEKLLNIKSIQFIKTIVTNQKLNLFCIDEIHLFVEFGISFRPIFQTLKDKIISLLYNNEHGNGSGNRMKIPILLMSATFDKTMYQIIQSMLGVQIFSNNIFWANASSFKKRHISIKMKYSLQSFKHTTDEICNHCKEDDSNKVIIISSTATKASEIQIKLDSWLDNKSNIPGDSVLVIGDQETETKFAYTTKFTNTVYGVNGENYSTATLCPRFMIGTPGCIGAGLDCSSVNLVCRLGFPTSLVHFIQEMGRCGRSNNINRSNTFSLCFHLNDYVYLIERLYITNEQPTQSHNNILTVEKERQYYIENLNKMCRMVFCEFGCWHACLEFVSSNPFQFEYERDPITPCGSQCPFCDKSRNQYIKPINKQGMQSFLASTLMSNHDDAYTPSTLVKKLLDYPLVGRVIYGRQSAVKAEKSSDAAISILQLLACNIIHLHVTESQKPKAYCILSRTNHEPHYLIPEYWKNINHF